MNFSPDISHCVYWVLAKIWAPNSSQKIGNKFFIHHCQGWKEGSFVCETVWFFFKGEYSSVYLKFVVFFPKFSGDTYVEFQEKTISGEFFCNFLTSTKTCGISPYFLQFHSGFVLQWKKFTQVLSYVVSTQVRRHVHKQITKEDTGKKSQEVLISKNQFCSLSVCDLLHLTPWVFWSEFFTTNSWLCLLSFCWNLSPRFVSQDWQ